MENIENIENVTGDVLDLNNQFASYQDYKAAVDTEMNRAAESFVRIGYLLKIARDTDILKESGYANVNEFAESIYHLDKSQVSRFININDTFAGKRLFGQAAGTVSGIWLCQAGSDADASGRDPGRDPGKLQQKGN